MYLIFLYFPHFSCFQFVLPVKLGIYCTKPMRTKIYFNNFQLGNMCTNRKFTQSYVSPKSDLSTCTIQGVPRIKVNSAGSNSRGNSELAVSHKHGSDSQMLLGQQ
jgi:hypothetical protein